MRKLLALYLTIMECNCSQQLENRWFDVDPQSLGVQIVGYCAAAGVIGHSIPTLVTLCITKNPLDVPLGSLIARIIVGVNIAVFGLLIFQTPQVVSGFGSLLILLPIGILRQVYIRRGRQGRQGRQQSKEGGKEGGKEGVQDEEKDQDKDQEKDQGTDTRRDAADMV